jgi:hypothetical protein
MRCKPCSKRTDPRTKKEGAVEAEEMMMMAMTGELLTETEVCG